jgi:hypothetical protein
MGSFYSEFTTSEEEQTRQEQPGTIHPDGRGPARRAAQADPIAALRVE